MVTKAKFTVKKRRAKSGTYCAPPGNSRALSHGVYSELTPQSLDGRSKVAKTLRAINRFLVAELGGEPSTQEMLIIERASFKAVKCILAEIAMLNGNGNGFEGHYLAWSNSLRLDLCTLGLERRQKEVTDLTEYIQKKAEEGAEQDTPQPVQETARGGAR